MRNPGFLEMGGVFGIGRLHVADKVPKVAVFLTGEFDAAGAFVGPRGGWFGVLVAAWLISAPAADGMVPYGKG